jgi:hypothetical protein
MNFLMFLRYELAFYWAWWICFIAIGFCLARQLGILGVFASIVLISILIVGIEVHSVFKDMHEHPELGRDADGVFVFGVLCRIVVFNIFVLPVSIVALKLRAHRKRLTNDKNVS